MKDRLEKEIVLSVDNGVPKLIILGEEPGENCVNGVCVVKESDGYSLINDLED